MGKSSPAGNISCHQCICQIGIADTANLLLKRFSDILLYEKVVALGSATPVPNSMGFLFYLLLCDFYGKIFEIEVQNRCYKYPTHFYTILQKHNCMCSFFQLALIAPNE